MDIAKPQYYDSFHCLAGACPDSCCKEWDVDVDDASAARYRALPGELGDKLRRALKDTPDGVQMASEYGRCPMWRADGLCRVQAELGEGALCDVCRTFPRLRHDYGDFCELGLELSCPEAARLILSDSGSAWIHTTEPGGEAPEYDSQDMQILKESRTQALSLLKANPPGRALALLLLYGAQAQLWLDTGEKPDADISRALAALPAPNEAPDGEAFFAFFQSLEILTPRWRALLHCPKSWRLPAQTNALARYLIQRYWLQAISDWDLAARVKFAVISCILVGSLPGNYRDNAQLFSKEIENDADNVDAILSAASTESCFSGKALLSILAAAGE